MFDNLVESGSHKKDLSRKGSFLLVTIGIYVVIGTVLFVATILLVDASVDTSDLELTTLSDKSALDDATKLLGMTRARLDARLATLGRSAGPPWGKDQKEAAAAALVALKRAKHGTLT